MTYFELRVELTTLSKEQLEADVVVYDSLNDEYIPVKSIFISDDDSVIDIGQPALLLQDERIDSI